MVLMHTKIFFIMKEAFVSLVAFSDLRIVSRWHFSLEPDSEKELSYSVF